MTRLLSVISFLLVSFLSFAQQYAGMTGLIQVPSAEMDTVGDARIGAHYLNQRMLPKAPDFSLDGKRRNAVDIYMSITPFSWVEVAYVFTLHNEYQSHPLHGTRKIKTKDRYFSVKATPLKEGKYYPSVALGYQDCFSFGHSDNHGVFSNYYLALTKHIMAGSQQFGVTLAYRHYLKVYNRDWDGVVGGITYRPSFARNWRAVVEWTGSEVNFGIDCLLWKHLLLQASLTDAKYPSGGICYKVNLF